MLRKELMKIGCSENFWFDLHHGLNLLAAILIVIAFAIAVHVIREEDGKSHWKEYTHFIVGLVIFLVTLLQAMYALLSPHPPHKEEKNESVKNNADEENTTVNKTMGEESTDKESKETAAVEKKSEEESTVKVDEEDAETKEVKNKDENKDKNSKETASIGEKSLHRLGWEIKHRFLGVGLLATAWWQLRSGWELYDEEDGGEDNGAALLGVAGGISGIIVIVYVVQKLRSNH